MRNDIKFHTLFKNMIDGSALHELKFNEKGDPIDYIILDANPSFERQLGISRESIIGKSSCEAYGVSDPPFFDIYKQVVFKGEPTVFETFFAPLGKYFSISAYQTHKTGFATIFEDITEKHSYAQSIVNNNERLQSIVNILQFEANHLQEFLDHALNELIKLTDSKIGYIYFYDEEKKEFVLNSWSKEVMKECAVSDPQNVYCLDKTGLWGEAVRQKRPIINNNFDDFHPHKKGYPSGHVHLKKFLTIPVFFNKKIVAVAGVANKKGDYDQTDILQMTLLMDAVWKTTERIKSDKALQESLTKYKLLFDSFPVGITVSDSEGKIIETNSVATKLLGISEEEQKKRLINGEEWHIVRNDGTPMSPDEYASVRALKEGKQISNVEMGICKSANEAIWINVSAVPIPMKGYGVVVAYNDITERYRAEQEINQKNKELQKLNTEKDKFFSIIAHDLKSPFNSIIGFSELLDEKVMEKDLEGIAKYAGVIRKSSNRAMDLLINLMEWTQSQTGRMEFNPEYFEMVDLIKGVEALFADIAKQKSLTISKTLPHHAPIYADKSMVSTILRNLISNSIKFTSPGGKINISAIDNDNELVVKVSDNGVGVPRERIEKLFKIDQNNSTKGTQNERGTGLGLILCKEFVEKHSGKIWVESGEGEGASFYFTIPNTFENEDNKILNNENY